MNNQDLINQLCACVDAPSVLNALHACPPGHPLNNAWQWRNAYVLAREHTTGFILAAEAILELKARAVTALRLPVISR
jgi:hypothetical protein